MHGDFSYLEPFLDWKEIEPLDAEAQAEALTCACFLGRTDIAEALLGRGVDPAAGNRTGLDALHWAADRGQLEALRLLLKYNAPLETRSMYDGTVLGAAVWSALHARRPQHAQIIEELLKAGARRDAVDEAQLKAALGRRI